MLDFSDIRETSAVKTFWNWFDDLNRIAQLQFDLNVLTEGLMSQINICLENVFAWLASRQKSNLV